MRYSIRILLHYAESVFTNRYGATPIITTDSTVLKAIEDSVSLLKEHLRRGQTVYGVTTGVGTNADTRTNHVYLLQKSLIQHQHAGILTAAEKGKQEDSHASRVGAAGQHSMPIPMVRAMMLIRCNSLLRGHSAVRINVIEAILSLAAHDLTPVVPLRGSISASGDLMPLSYVAGALEGNKDIFVRRGAKEIITSSQALELANLQTISFGPKEVLGLLNGTAASCGAASLAIHQVRHQAVLVQVMTAIATEALLGSRHNHDPFISSVRPHSGQIEAAAIILACLKGSYLATDRDATRAGLFQDRYPLRTASQWIGPQLEDLTLATQQIQVELNSTTDNPLIDVANDLVHHGGNFQAASLTSAMEKTLNVVQMLGRLVFTQCSELLNSGLNKGLPPNLCIDDPSLSFTFKGVDISMAAHMSELAHLTHPVGPYVQSAEMDTQAINSLALLAARTASEASDLLALMSANFLYALCQALDLRCLHLEFATAAEPKVFAILSEAFASILEGTGSRVEDVHAELWPLILAQWLHSSSLDLEARGSASAKKVLGYLVTTLQTKLDGKLADTSDVFSRICAFQAQLSTTLISVYSDTRIAFLKHPPTPKYLGLASKIMYEFIRSDLKVPPNRGLVDYPTINVEDLPTDLRSMELLDSRGEKVTIGTQISRIYEAIRSEAAYDPVMRVIGEVERQRQESDLAL